MAIAKMRSVSSHAPQHKSSGPSNGQQQRVAIIRTLANDLTVVPADEPTGNLDAETRGQVLGLVADMNPEERSIVIVTHDPSAAAHACQELRLNHSHVLSGEIAKGGLRVAV